MSQAPFWPVATDAFIADTTHLTAEQTGAYMMLLMCLWRSNGKPLPLEHKKLCRMARVGPNRWPKIWEEIQDFFIVENGMVTQNRLCKDWVTVQEKITRNRQSGSLGGKAKALKIKEMELANATIPPKRNSTNQNQNHKDIKDIDKSISKKSSSKRKNNVRTIKTEFKTIEGLPAEYLEYAEQAGFTKDWIDIEFRKFYRYFDQKGYRRPGWLASWETWIDNAIQRKTDNNSNSNGQSKPAINPFLVAAQKIMDE